MEIELKNGKWITKDGKGWSDLNHVERLLFNVLLTVEKIIKKYNL